MRSAIATLLSQKAGFDPGAFSASRLTRAIATRQAACNLADAQVYLARVRSSLPECEALIEELIVPETWFFRDRKPFDYLKHIVSERSFPGRLRLLSVPCSTGEEPYSLAIALLEAGLAPDQFAIDAVDISHHSIAKAKRGVYTKNSFRGEAWSHRDRYFQQTPNGFQLHDSLLKLVNFQQGNALTPMPAMTQPYNVIFCRNLLIYLHEEGCLQVLQAIDRCLVPGGLLFMGASETGKIDLTRYRSVRQPFTFAFRKLDAAQPTLTRSLPEPLPKTTVRASTVRSSNVAAMPPINRAVGARRNAVDQVASVPNLQTVIQCVESIQGADAGQLTEAIAQCKTYLSHDRTSAEAYLLLGQLYQATQQDSQAEQCFQRALYLKPDSQAALLYLVALKQQQGDHASGDRLQQRLERLQHQLKSQG